jgi:hypothetical protein
MVPAPVECGALPEFRPSRGETAEPWYILKLDGKNAFESTTPSPASEQSRFICPAGPQVERNFIETICRVAHFSIAVMTLGASVRAQS